MTVNVSLCGATPRSEMVSCSSKCRPRLNQTEVPPSRTDQIIAMAASSLSRKVSEDNIVSNSQVIEPPSWAVPARGESFLEVSLICTVFVSETICVGAVQVY